MGHNLNWTLARTAQLACVLEADAPKLGNVNRFHDFEDCTLEDFHVSAVAIGPAFSQIGQNGVGRTVFEAVKATRAVTTTNTNLGMLLLLAPLGLAWCRAENKAVECWRVEARKVLTALSVEDACYAYQAIRLAKPGGLGEVGEHDVTTEQQPPITLLQAMELAAERDLVAGEYVNDFELVFTKGYTMLRQSLAAGLVLPQAIAQIHLYLLSLTPDTLIVRKLGQEAGREVKRRAGLAWELGGWLTPEGRLYIEGFDRWLRIGGHRRNPGATADVTAAAIFVWLLHKEREEEVRK